jgi:hypothetical protein
MAEDFYISQYKENKPASYRLQSKWNAILANRKQEN